MWHCIATSSRRSVCGAPSIVLQIGLFGKRIGGEGCENALKALYDDHDRTFSNRRPAQHFAASGLKGD
jgi:hypothetical protein